MTTRRSLATLAVVLLILVVGIGVLYAVRSQVPPTTTVSSTPSATPAPSTPVSSAATSTPLATATPTAAASPGVLAPPAIAYPIPVQLTASSGGVVWVLVGGRWLYRSTDGGATWTQRGLPGTGTYEQSFVSDREGFVIAVGIPEPCASLNGGMWHTTDGGATYESFTATGLQGIQGCPAGLAFADARAGWIGASFNFGRYGIARTSDGGHTWLPAVGLEPPANTTLAAPFGVVRAFGSTLLVQTGRNASQSAQPSGLVFRSLDVGASWNYLLSGPDQLSFVTATRWISLGGPGQSQESTDAGATWHPFTTDYSQAAPVAPVVLFVDAQTGYASNSRGAIQRTIDGGLHWSPVRSPGAP